METQLKIVQEETKVLILGDLAVLAIAYICAYIEYKHSKNSY